MPRNSSVYTSAGLYRMETAIEIWPRDCTMTVCIERAAHAPVVPQVLPSALVSAAPRMEEQASG